MQLDESLSKEIKFLFTAGLTENQIRLLKTPFNQMQNGEASIAITARDKLDDFKSRQAIKGIWYNEDYKPVNLKGEPINA